MGSLYLFEDSLQIEPVMLIVQGEKTKCALHRGEGIKGLVAWSVSSEPRKSLSLFSRKVIMQSSQPNCIAQDSHVWHLGHLHVQAACGIDHLFGSRAVLGRHTRHLDRLSSFLTTIPFHTIMYKLFTSLRRSQRKGGLRQSGLLAFAPGPFCSIQYGLYSAKVFF